MRHTYTIVLIALIAACTDKPSGDHELATSIAKGLVAACPAGSDPADESARNDCAGKLTELGVLRDAMCVDDDGPAGVYLGTRSGSVYASRDEGEHWAPVVEQLPDVLCVRAVVV